VEDTISITDQKITISKMQLASSERILKLKSHFDAIAEEHQEVSCSSFREEHIPEVSLEIVFSEWESQQK